MTYFWERSKEEQYLIKKAFYWEQLLIDSDSCRENPMFEELAKLKDGQALIDGIIEYFETWYD